MSDRKRPEEVNQVKRRQAAGTRSGMQTRRIGLRLELLIGLLGLAAPPTDAQHQRHHQQFDNQAGLAHQQAVFEASAWMPGHLFSYQPQAPQQQQQQQAQSTAHLQLGLAPMNAIQLEPEPEAERLSAPAPSVSPSAGRSLVTDQNQGQSEAAESAAPSQVEPAAESEQPPAALVDRTVQPRHRRRIFNRILKKAEWNHLFVEVSKVFLRYFLDLALKDIIGKQAGGTGSPGGGDTSSRKKLDAQSEIADMFKEFVKTAISNI